MSYNNITFDSNIFINSFRSKEYAEGLEKYFEGACEFCISRVVLMELWAGAKITAEKRVLQQLEREFPLLDFGPDNFIEAGKILQKMTEKFCLKSDNRRRLTWDILIALNIKESSTLLITENISDFRKIRSFIKFAFQAPIRLSSI